MMASLSQHAGQTNRAGAGQDGQRRDERDPISPYGEDRDQDGGIAGEEHPDRPRDSPAFGDGPERSEREEQTEREAEAADFPQPGSKDEGIAPKEVDVFVSGDFARDDQGTRFPGEAHQK